VSSPVILVDENVPYAADAFGTLGDVRLMHGRRIARDHLCDVDALVVRSITRVTGDLLAGTPVRFVGTATAGVDHVAADDLHLLGVTFASAAGCNANAVAEYMAAAWLTVAERQGASLRGRRVGVVGVGHVGSRVVHKAVALGMVPVLNDPPKARATGSQAYGPLDALADCDIVTCHTPLTFDGPDPTYRLIGERFLSHMTAGAWFCNAGRGEVVDEAALHRTLDAGRLGACMLDVWDREPAIDARLVERVDVATPHIAGYSLEGKLNGTGMVYEALCAFLGTTPTWSAAAAAPPASVPEIRIDVAGRSAQAVAAEVVKRVYDVGEDDRRLRQTVAMTPEERGRVFDDQRRTYPVRREFGQTTVRPAGAGPDVVATLRGLGFAVTESG